MVEMCFRMHPQFKFTFSRKNQQKQIMLRNILKWFKNAPNLNMLTMGLLYFITKKIEAKINIEKFFAECHSGDPRQISPLPSAL